MFLVNHSVCSVHNKLLLLLNGSFSFLYQVPHKLRTLSDFLTCRFRSVRFTSEPVNRAAQLPGVALEIKIPEDVFIYFLRLLRLIYSFLRSLFSLF